MSTHGPDDPESTPPPAAPELGGLDPQDLLKAGLDTIPALTQPTQPPSDPDATIPVSKPQPTQPELPTPGELTALLPHGMYRVESFLGQGGMGAVYKGTQVRLKRQIAIKIMRRDAGKDYDFEARFEREAHAMAQLNHPNIVSVIDYGEAGPDYLYIVMELVDGADMMDVIRTGRMTQEMALTLLPQICDALQFAHDHGIVHRDIKPSNIMLTRDGRIKMADFGLAKRFDAESSFRTQTGTGMGTPDYAAPEQFEANGNIDHRADIYALGVMIYQMITGTLPRGVWKPPSQRAEIDPHWDDIVSRAMQSDPADRYQQASEVKTDVSGISLAAVAGFCDPGGAGPPSAKPTPHPSAPPPASQRLATTKSRAPLFFVLIVGTVILVVGGFHGLKTPDTRRSDVGTSIDLLAQVDVARDAVFGQWKRTSDGVAGGGAATLKNADAPRLQLAYAPPDEYDFEIEFTPTGGSGMLCQILSTHEQSFAWTISTGGPSAPTIGFGQMDGKAISSGGESSAGMEALIQNGRRYRSRVEVRRGSLCGFLDGKEMVTWKGDFNRLSLAEGWKLPAEFSLGVGVSSRSVIFHSIEVREISGKGRRINIGTASSSDALASSPAVPKNLPKGEWIPIKLTAKDVADSGATLSADGRLKPGRAVVVLPGITATDVAIRARVIRSKEANLSDLSARLNDTANRTMRFWTDTTAIQSVTNDGHKGGTNGIPHDPLLGVTNRVLLEMAVIGDRTFGSVDGVRIGPHLQQLPAQGGGVGLSGQGSEFSDIEVMILDGVSADKYPDFAKAHPVAAESEVISSPVLQFQGHHYQLQAAKGIAWEAAKKAAESAGGHLAVITTKDENAWLMSQFVEPLLPSKSLKLWIGARREKSGQPWRWVNAEPFEYADWAKNEGDDSGDIPYCGALSQFKHWIDASNASYSNTNGYIVEWPDKPAAAVAQSPLQSSSPQWVKLDTSPHLDKSAFDADGWLKPMSQFTELTAFSGKNQAIRFRSRVSSMTSGDAHILAVRSRDPSKGPTTRLQLIYSVGAGKATLRRNDGTSTTMPILKALSDLPLEPKAELTMELAVVGDRLISRINGQLQPAVTDSTYADGYLAFRNAFPVRDIEVINLDGLPETEALRLLGVDEKGNDLRGKQSSAGSSGASQQPSSAGK